MKVVVTNYDSWFRDLTRQLNKDKKKESTMILVVAEGVTLEEAIKELEDEYEKVKDIE